MSELNLTCPCPSCGQTGVKVEPNAVEIDGFNLSDEDVSGPGPSQGERTKLTDDFGRDVKPPVTAVRHCVCTSCQQTVGLWLGDKFRSLDELLSDQLDLGMGSKSSKSQSGCKSNQIWFQVERKEERLALYVLNQIIYKFQDSPQEDLLEFEFCLPPPTDIVKLAWVQGSAVGFYSVKPKGTFDIDTLETYSMPVVDTIFVRSTHRRQGLASAALQDLLQQFPDTSQDVGFSHPVSHSMLQMVRKHLEKREQDRLRLWEITGCGREGNRRNLWFHLHQKPKPKKPRTTETIRSKSSSSS